MNQSQDLLLIDLDTTSPYFEDAVARPLFKSKTASATYGIDERKARLLEQILEVMEQELFYWEKVTLSIILSLQLQLDFFFQTIIICLFVLEQQVSNSAATISFFQ